LRRCCDDRSFALELATRLSKLRVTSPLAYWLRYFEFLRWAFRRSPLTRRSCWTRGSATRVQSGIQGGTGSPALLESDHRLSESEL